MTVLICTQVFARICALVLVILPEQVTPLANYWLTLLQQVGVPIDRFSHSTGNLGELLT